MGVRYLRKRAKKGGRVLAEAENTAAELYERFRQGDKAAFESLVIEYRYGLTLFINRFVSDMSIAEDIAEDVFVRLLVKKPRYKGNASFKTWLFTVGRNLAVDHLRKHRRVVLDDDPQQERAEGTEEVFLKSERERALHRALEVLPEEERQLMHLIYLEGLGYDHAEKVLGVSKTKLYAMSYKAKETLKTELMKEGIEF